MSADTVTQINCATDDEMFGSIDYYALADGRHAVEVAVWNRERAGTKTRVYFETLEQAHALLGRLKR